MKISFPYMGSITVYKNLLKLLKHDVIVPPRPSQRTIDLGVKYSPEFACFPFKVIMGTYIECCEMGADTIVTSGGHGPCRAGFYAQIHKEILKSIGYDVNFIVFDSFFKNKKTFLSNLNKLKGNNSWFEFLNIARHTYNVVKNLDYFEKRLSTVRAYEINKGQCNNVWEKIQVNFENIKNKVDLNNAVEICSKIIDDIKIELISQENKIKIGIVGEIYVVMESSINMEIEKMLGDFGCEVERSQYLSEWIKDNGVPDFLSKNENEILDKGEEYIEIIIGGHAKQTIGHIIDFKEKGFDGIIHLMPFGCLPELVSQSVIPKISDKYDIPILSISLDEQSGRANNTTRIEAFIDLVKNKKKKII